MLRPMAVDDIAAVLAIESAATSYPWSFAQFKDSASGRDDASILEVENVIIGFSIFQRVLDECTLLNIVVHPDWQGRGYGLYLLQQGLGYQSKAGSKKCFLEVRRSNNRAQKLYLAQGFRQIAVRKKYYPGPHEREDALVMCRELPDAISLEV